MFSYSHMDQKMGVDFFDWEGEHWGRRVSVCGVVGVSSLLLGSGVC